MPGESAELFATYRRLNEIYAAVINQPHPQNLSRLYRLLARLGNPQDTFPSVIITGSKGKGSTTHFLAALLQQATINNLIRESSRKIGLFTGPHLHTFRERIKINRQNIAPPDFVRLFQQVQAASGEEYISRFEILTAMAFLYFAESRVDYAVLEVGLGGRFDAVNTAGNVLLTIFTPIELEHVKNLGPNIENIVWHKAGIMRPEVPVLSTGQSLPVIKLIEKYSVEAQTSPHWVNDYWQPVPDSAHLSWENEELVQHFDAQHHTKEMHQIKTSLPGTFQQTNALTALAAMELLLEYGKLSGQQAVIGLDRLADVTFEGRFEVVSTNPLIIIDSAHTPNAMRQLTQTLAMLPGKPIWVLGFLRDKNLAEMLRELPLDEAIIYLVDTGSHRNASTELITTSLRNSGKKPAKVISQLPLGQACHEASQHIRAGEGDYLIITGSIYLAARARHALGLLDPAIATEAEYLWQVERELFHP